MSARSAARTTAGWAGLDKLGLLLSVLAAAGLSLPLVAFRANRIVLGEGQGLFVALPIWMAVPLLVSLALALGSALLRGPALWRVATSLVAAVVLIVALGAAASNLTPEGDTVARVSPGGGFWLLLLAVALLAADGLARLRPKPLLRLALLVLVGGVMAAILASGTLNAVSVLREYANRADAFWAEGRTHLILALGSLAAATQVGVPLGIFCQRTPALRAPVLNLLNAIQTIPSIALFGLLIAPLGWVALNVPGAAAIGVSGIGTAPALLALFGYALLPVVANTVVGIDGVAPAANDAARGMGMTDGQRLWSVQLPLAFPVILTGIRIVLVQNIGLATIAALIGGGGFGVFVFQGVGQTAMDLVLLGAVPTIVLAFAAAIILDAAVELVTPRGAAR